jgi:hypothetical protein
MVGALGAVLLAAAPELRPDEREDAVGEAARLEVALERKQRVAGQLQPGREAVWLIRVRVVHAVRAERDAVEGQAGR